MWQDARASAGGGGLQHQGPLHQSGGRIVGDATHEAEIVGRGTRPHDRTRPTNGYRVSHDSVRPTADPRPTIFADPARPAPEPRTMSAPTEPTPTATPVEGLPIQSARARFSKRALDLLAAVPLTVVFAVVYPFV